MRLLKNTLFAVLCTASFASMAGDILPYSQQQFESLAAKGKSVVVDVTAPWCPTCARQKPIVESLMLQPAYKDITVLTVDFDSAKATLKQFKVSSQSTLIAFKGNAEVARSVGDTSASSIEDLIKKAL